MRKLLLLINCFVLCTLLLSCKTPTKKNSEIEIKTTTAIVTKDSLLDRKVVIQNDTTKTITNTSTHSDNQTKTANPSNSKQTIKTKPIQTKRIDHGSDNQAKLDSIKKAKGKLKN